MLSDSPVLPLSKDKGLDFKPSKTGMLKNSKAFKQGRNATKEGWVLKRTVPNEKVKQDKIDIKYLEDFYIKCSNQPEAKYYYFI